MAIMDLIAVYGEVKRVTEGGNQHETENTDNQ